MSAINDKMSAINDKMSASSPIYPADYSIDEVGSCFNER